MGILTRAALLLAAGAAGWALARRKSAANRTESDPRVVYLSDEDAVSDTHQTSSEPEAVHARIRQCFRRMDPVTLQGASDVTFVLDDETEVKLLVHGEGGIHLQAGDCGMLTWSGMQFILFEKDNGEVVGGMFYAPAEEISNE